MKSNVFMTKEDFGSLRYMRLGFTAADTYLNLISKSPFKHRKLVH